MANCCKGDKLRRLVRKLDLRSDRALLKGATEVAEFHQKQKQLLKAYGGITATITLRLSMLQNLYLRRDAGVTEASLPFYDLSFDLLEQQRQIGGRLAFQLTPMFFGCDSVFQRILREQDGFCDVQEVVIGVAHPPRCEHK